MNRGSIDYTINSVDSNHYNRITACLQAPPTEMSTLTVTNLTANCNIAVLDYDDFIEFDGNRYVEFNKTYTNLNAETFSALINSKFLEVGIPITTKVDVSERIVLYAKDEFNIMDASYNIRLLMGWYNVEFPISCIKSDVYPKTPYEYLPNSVGYYLSTPVLYLVSNLGSKCYRNLNYMSYGTKWYQSVGYGKIGVKYNKNMIGEAVAGQNILMRLNNSYAANMPIIAANAEFETTVVSNDLSNIDFTLVDANMKEVRLLSPMYLSINIKPVESKDTDADIFIPGGMGVYNEQK